MRSYKHDLQKNEKTGKITGINAEAQSEINDFRFLSFKIIVSLIGFIFLIKACVD